MKKIPIINENVFCPAVGMMIKVSLNCLAECKFYHGIDIDEKERKFVRCSFVESLEWRHKN